MNSRLTLYGIGSVVIPLLTTYPHQDCTHAPSLSLYLWLHFVLFHAVWPFTHVSFNYLFVFMMCVSC